MSLYAIIIWLKFVFDLSFLLTCSPCLLLISQNAQFSCLYLIQNCPHIHSCGAYCVLHDSNIPAIFPFSMDILSLHLQHLSTARWLLSFQEPVYALVCVSPFASVTIVTAVLFFVRLKFVESKSNIFFKKFIDRYLINICAFINAC